MREAIYQPNLQTVIDRVGVAQLVRDAAEHGAAELRILRIALVEDASQVGVTCGSARTGNRRVDVAPVQQVDAGIPDIPNLKQPSAGELILHLQIVVV